MIYFTQLAIWNFTFFRCVMRFNEIWVFFNPCTAFYLMLYSHNMYSIYICFLCIILCRFHFFGNFQHRKTLWRYIKLFSDLIEPLSTFMLYVEYLHCNPPYGFISSCKKISRTIQQFKSQQVEYWGIHKLCGPIV